MSHHQHDQSNSSHADSSPNSSGAVTPTTASASSSYLSSSVSNLWGGLVRRFSSDASTSFSSTSPSTHQHAFGSSPNNNGIDGVYAPPIHRTASPMRPPPLEPLVLGGFRDDTALDARLLTTAIAEEIRIMVPARLAIVDEWNLVYSLDQDGASLATLYKKCGAYDGKRVGLVLVVKDMEGGIFGAYLSDYPHPSPKYFGTGECFLWRASLLTSLPPPPSADTTNLTRTATIAASPTAAGFPQKWLTNSPDPESSLSSCRASNSAPPLLSPTPTTHNSHGHEKGPGPPQPPPSPSIRFKAFPYSGVNEYYMLCEQHFLSVGAGDGSYGLWLDDSLARGVSSTSLTFGNERLSDEGEKFGVLGVEVWVVGAAGP